MFANAFQSGFISIFYSVGTTPLAIWDKQVKNGHIRRVIDEEVKSLVLEVSGTNVATTYITCPIKPRATLGIKLPFLVMIIKNMNKYFTFEIQILDDKDMHRRFRVSNFQSTTKVRPFCTTMPIGLSKGWNQVQFNLADFTKRAYGSTYLETQRVQIHANVRIRRIYFADQLYSEEDLPNEFKLFVPTTQRRDSKKKADAKKDRKEAAEEAPPGALPTPVGTTPRLDEAAASPADEGEVKPPEEAPTEPAEAAETAPEADQGPPAEIVEEAVEEGQLVDESDVAEGGEAVAGEAAEAAEGEAILEEMPPSETGEPAGEAVEGGESVQDTEAAGGTEAAEAAGAGDEVPSEKTEEAPSVSEPVEGGDEPTTAEDITEPVTGDEGPSEYIEDVSGGEGFTTTEGETEDEAEATDAPTESLPADESPEE